MPRHAGATAVCTPRDLRWRYRDAVGERLDVPSHEARIYASLAEAAVFDPKTTITGVASPAYDAALNVIAPAIQGFMSGTDAVEQIREELQSKLK